MAVMGREAEQLILKDFLNSSKPEFIAIYGRRRIGKTYLVREFFKDKKAIFFSITGARECSLSEQIGHFTKEIGNIFYNGALLKQGKNWNETFELLTKAISATPQNKKVVLFLDEFPWMATRKSKLLQNLDYYWNQHWSNDKRIKLIICGSSASWIINKIINNKGGLHNRITRPALFLEPLKLQATKRFLNRQGVKLTNKQILQIYMITGGVPYYINNIQKSLSATQIIEQLAFRQKSLLLNEFDNLFSSLFNNHQICEDIIRIISQYRYGIGQEELFQKIDKRIKGKLGLTKLKELEEAGFIISFVPHFHRRRGIYYKLIDEYTLFYLKWIEPIKKTLLRKTLPPGYWEKQQNSPSWNSWSGLSFESICYKHIEQISKSLKLSPTAIPSTWRYAPKKESVHDGAQIDLLFDRDDDAITLCEIKYTDTPFIIDKQYAKILQKKIDVFKKVTKTDKQIFLAIISVSGIKQTIYSEEMVDAVITLDDLFVGEE
jgi:AAA+ ATPase superfamily predicted ATPase